MNQIPFIPVLLKHACLETEPHHQFHFARKTLPEGSVPNEKGRPHRSGLFRTTCKLSLTLGELEALTRFSLTILLTFYYAAVAGQEACRFQRPTQ